MHGRSHGDRRMDGIDAEEFLRHLADLRQALVQLLLAELAQIQVHDLPLRRGDRATFLLLVPERLAEAIAWTELHRLLARPWVGRSQAVILQIAITVLV